MRISAWRRAHVVLTVLLIAVLAGNAQPRGQEPDTYKLSVNVNLVVLDATVRRVITAQRQRRW